MKFPRISRVLGGSWGINPHSKHVDLSEEELNWTPINIPKIDHEEELQKLREHITANPDGDYDLEHFNVSPEKLAVETIRAKVSELNKAIAKAVEFGIKVEIDTLDHYRSDRPGCPATHLTATISKTL